MIPQVLVVDAAAGTPAAYLRPADADGLDLTVVSSGAEARIEVEANPPDVILLDPVLPDADGVRLCRWLRTWPGAPIIAVSSATDDRTQLALFAAGVDDVVGKPVSVVVLRARIEVQLRHQRLAVAAAGGEIVVGALRLDTAALRADVDGRPLELTPTLFRMLRILAHDPDVVVSTRAMARALGQTDSHDPGNAIRIGISRLRRRLGSGPGVPQIHNERHAGYRLSRPPS